MEMAIVKPATSRNTNGPTYAGHGRARKAESAQVRGLGCLSLWKGVSASEAMEVATARPSSPSSSSYYDPQ